MADWKNEIRQLIRDFNIPLNYKDIVREVERKCKTTTTPVFYEGNLNDFFYDRAYAKVKPYILA